MTQSPGSPAKRRANAYFTASFEVARRLADGRGDEAIEVLRRELERTEGNDGDGEGRRFLMTQIALCHARMDRPEAAEEVLQELESEFGGTTETALMLAEGYLLLLDMHERAAHHAALALQWAEREGEDAPKLLSRARSLLARSLLAGGDLTGAFGAWQACELPEWRVGVDLVEAGFDAKRVREVLLECLPRHDAHERRMGSSGVAASDQIRRLIAWIDAGCPRKSPTTS